MKIGVIGSPLQDGNKIRGVGFYTKNLFENLKNTDLITSYQLPITNYDLIHYPFFDPFSPTLKIFKTPTIVTVHDLIPLQFKKHFPVGVRGIINWYRQLFNLRRATAIITVSNYSKKIIHQITKIPLEKIHVTYLAPDKFCKPITDKKFLQKIKEKYKLPSKFVLYVGDINWNKNIPSLVKICQKLNYPLVIVGSSAVKKDVPNHPWTQDILYLQSKSKDLTLQGSNTLIFTGFIPDEELPAIYSLATIYCQPSHAEGFGLPPLQAMACGCPVICNFQTSLKELYEKYSLPFDKESFKKLWNNSKLRSKYSQLGLNYSKNFSWSKTAQKTLQIYEKYQKTK